MECQLPGLPMWAYGSGRMSPGSAACPPGPDDDILTFAEDESGDALSAAARAPWKILVVDDDVSVHAATLFALSGVTIAGRALEFVHAYSAAEARRAIEVAADIALVLLDCVMETQDAGLRLVNAIRVDMGRPDLRIVLRTGQPGYAPQQRVMQEYAIDGYLLKGDLTRTILLSTLTDLLDPGAAGAASGN